MHTASMLAPVIEVFLPAVPFNLSDLKWLTTARHRRLRTCLLVVCGTCNNIWILPSQIEYVDQMKPVKPGQPEWPELFQELAQGTRLPLDMATHGTILKEMWRAGGKLHCNMQRCGTQRAGIKSGFDEMRAIFLNSYPDLAEAPGMAPPAGADRSPGAYIMGPVAAAGDAEAPGEAQVPGEASSPGVQQQPAASTPFPAVIGTTGPTAGRVSPFAAAAAAARWSSGALDAAPESPAAEAPAAEPPAADPAAAAAAMQQPLEVLGIPPGLAPIRTSMPGQQPRLLQLHPIPEQQPALPASSEPTPVTAVRTSLPGQRRRLLKPHPIQPAQAGSSEPTPAAAAGRIRRLVQHIGRQLRRGIKRLRGVSTAAEEEEEATQVIKKQAVEAATGRPAATAAHNAAQQLQENPHPDPSPPASSAGGQEYELGDVHPAPASAAAAAAPPAAVPDPLEAAMPLLLRSGASASESELLRAAAVVIPCQSALTYLQGYFNYMRLAGHEHNLPLQDLVLTGQNVNLLVMVSCCWLATKQSAHEFAAEPEVVAGGLQVSLSVLNQLETAIGTVLTYGSFDEFVEQLMQAAQAAAAASPPSAAAAAAPPAAVPDPLAAAMELLTHSGASASESELLRAAAVVIPCHHALTYLLGFYNYMRLAGHEQNLQLQDLALVGEKVDFLLMVSCCWLATKLSAQEVAASPEVVAGRLRVSLPILHRLETAVGSVLMYGSFDEFVEQLMQAGPPAAPAAAVPEAGEV